MTASRASARSPWRACIALTRRARRCARWTASSPPPTASCCTLRICASAAATASMLARFRKVVAALALLGLLALVVPAGAQQSTSVNPTASSVKEDQLLRQLKQVEGRGSIPDVKSYVIEHPAGRDWRQFHEVTLIWI